MHSRTGWDEPLPVHVCHSGRVSTYFICFLLCTSIRHGHETGTGSIFPFASSPSYKIHALLLQQKYVVIGGNGFLGKRIVETLLSKGEENITILDITEASYDPRCKFVKGWVSHYCCPPSRPPLPSYTLKKVRWSLQSNICRGYLQQGGSTQGAGWCHHRISYSLTSLWGILQDRFSSSSSLPTSNIPLSQAPYELHYKVNVQGTQNVVEACITQNVKQLIYTSSANVVFGGKDIIGGGTLHLYIF